MDMDVGNIYIYRRLTAYGMDVQYNVGRVTAYGMMYSIMY